MISGTITINIKCETINKFYKRNKAPFDYILVGGCIPEVDVYVYANFANFEQLFDADNKPLSCGYKYILDNFNETTLEAIQQEVSG